MRLFRKIVFAIAVCAATQSVAQASDAPEVFEIIIRYETRSEGNRMTGSSSGGYHYREEVYARTGDCRLRRFDVVDDPEHSRPLALWKMPVLLRECAGQPAEIANREAMVARRDAFLSAAELPPEACGRHYFTWDVFKIECDPEAVIDTVERIDLSSLALQDGAHFLVRDTETRLTLTQAESGPDGRRTFTGRGTIDPEVLREQKASAIMVIAEVSGEEISLEQAMARIAEHRFAGEVSVKLMEEPAEDRITLTVVSETSETDAEGNTETRWGEEVTIRERVEAMPGSDPSN